MSILENEVWIGVNNNQMYLEERGYNIPKSKDINGIMRVKRGTKIIIKVEDVPKNSSIKVTKKCDICGEITFNQQYQNIIRSRENGDGLDRCAKCLRKKASKSRKNNVKYENSLEYFAIVNNKSYLLSEFSVNNIKRPTDISYGSHDKYLWICPICQSEYDMSVQIKTKKDCKCPYCTGKRVNNTNSLSRVSPELASEWHPTLNGELTPDDVTKGRKGKLWWLCPKCQNPYSSTINDRRSGCSCPICKESKGEKEIRQWLELNNIGYEAQKEFNKLKGVAGGNLSYDFYLPEFNLLIEYQGQQHEEFTKGFHSCEEDFKKQQEHDRRKRDYAKIYQIGLLEIWYCDFNNIEQILNKEVLSVRR